MHVPVLLDAALHWLDVRADALFVDATFGAGGHSAALVAAGARVIAFDRDPSAVVPAGLAERVTLVRDNFANLAAALDALGIDAVDGVLFDLGVSSMQLDRGERGFSFNVDADIDMRMDPTSGRSVRALLEETDESDLADIIFEFGEERAARRIARAIVAARDRGALPLRTVELARLVAGVVHVRGRRERTHPATRTFQALRIAVNDELGALGAGLAAATARTRLGGRIVAISFHSLEDRIVKQHFRDDGRLHNLTKKPILAEAGELEANPRSRSAKLRAAERVV